MHLPKNSKQPMKETYLLTSPLEKTNEAYALAKIIGLKICEFYNQQYKNKLFYFDAMQSLWSV